MEWFQNHFKNPFPSISRVYMEPGSTAEEFFCFEFDKDNPIKCEKFTKIFLTEQLNFLIFWALQNA